MQPKTSSRRSSPPADALARHRFPPEVMGVLRTLAASGHRSWVVGGAVRDALLRRTRRGADFDVATPATPQQVTALFPRVIPTGVEHGTVTVLSGKRHVEVTTFRGEGEYRDGRRPSSVTFLSDIDADLSRRDFTMNAMAWDPLAHELRDPFGGRRDLARRLVRAVGDPVQRFAEDGLRPMRAVRFAAQLGFSLDRATEHAIPGALQVTEKVSAERTCEEITRLLLAPHAARALTLMERTGLLALVFPGLATLDRALRAHALRAVASAGALRARSGGVSPLALRLAALLHAMAAVEPPHVVGRGLREHLTRLRFSGEVSEDVAVLVREHGCLLGSSERPGLQSAADVRRWLSRVGARQAGGVIDLATLDAASVPGRDARTAIAAARTLRARVRRVVAARPPLSTADLALDGKAIMAALGVGPGRVVGEALKVLLDRVLEDPALNTPAALESELSRWWSSRGERGGDPQPR